MNQQEAAKALRLSVRSLQRLVQSGKLSVTYSPGRTRSIPSFDENEIELLRATLRPVYPQSKATSLEPKTETFGFRCTAADRETLTVEGARYGLSAGEYARRLVQLGLESRLENKVLALEAEVHALKLQHTEQESSLDRLRTEFIETIEVVLEVAGLSHNEAGRWTQDNLRHKEQRCTSTTAKQRRS